MPSPFDSGPSYRPVTIGVSDSTGAFLVQPDAWARTYNYNGDSTLNYEEITNTVGTWRRTYTYSSGLVTAITGWVKQ